MDYKIKMYSFKIKIMKTWKKQRVKNSTNKQTCFCTYQKKNNIAGGGGIHL